MDNQSKKTNPNSSVVAKQFGFACSVIAERKRYFGEAVDGVEPS